MSDLPKHHEFFMRSYSLEHTARYSMKPVIKSESVATHSFYVALAVMLMSSEYKFNVSKAVQIALCHDLAEIEISDVNHVVKQTYPAVAVALRTAEMSIVSNFPDEVKDYCKEYDIESPESLIVHYCDAWQCYQYASGELELGNNGYMKEVHVRSRERMNILTTKLAQYRKQDNDN